MGEVVSGDRGAGLGACGFVLVLRRYDKFAAAEPHVAYVMLDIFARHTRNALVIGHRMMCLVQSDDPRLSSPAVGATPVVWNDAEWLNSRRGLSSNAVEATVSSMKPNSSTPNYADPAEDAEQPDWDRADRKAPWTSMARRPPRRPTFVEVRTGTDVA